MNKRYKINEVARIFGISRQTLIYYDKIKLFQPDYIDEENSYRYYIQEQFFQLRFILILKKAGFSLNEIKEYTKSGTPEESLIYLEEKERDLEEKIALLEESKNTIGRKIEELKNITQKRREAPKFIEVKPRKVFRVALERPFNFENFDSPFHKIAEKREELGIEGNDYFEELDKKSMEEKDYMGLTRLGFFLPDDWEKIEGEEWMDGGKYATIVHRDTWSRIGESYEELQSFIEGEGYKIRGDAVEVFSNTIVHLGKGEGTTVRIFIPVEKEAEGKKE